MSSGAGRRAKRRIPTGGSRASAARSSTSVRRTPASPDAPRCRGKSWPRRSAAADAGIYSVSMVQTTLEARQQLLDSLAEAIDQIGLALASVGAAYEQLDESSADQLEAELFRPVQLAYGRARRTHAEFAARHGLAGREFEPRSPGLPSIGARAFIDNAVTAVGQADHTLVTLQDSLLPVEVGDPELRAALAELRE